MSGPLNSGHPLSAPKRGRSMPPQVHETATACSPGLSNVFDVTLTSRPYDQGGSVIHLTSGEARELMRWLIQRYAIDALGALA